MKIKFELPHVVSWVGNLDTILEIGYNLYRF